MFVDNTSDAREYVATEVALCDCPCRPFQPRGGRRWRRAFEPPRALDEPFTRTYVRHMARSHELESLRRSIAMLEPRTKVLTREEAMALIADLKEAMARLQRLREGLAELLAESE